MFCRLLDGLFECCRLPNVSHLNAEPELRLENLEIYPPDKRTDGGCFNVSGSYLGSIMNYSSFRPNNSIRCLTSNLHQRYGTNQLSMLPKYEAEKFATVVSSEQSDPDNELVWTITESGIQAGSKLVHFIQLLSRGIMVKQVVNLILGETKYIAIYLSKNLNSLILDNFGGVLLEVPLKFVIDVVFSDFSSDQKTLINDLANRKGYEPVKLNEEIQYLVSIDVGTQIKSICLTFGSEADGMSFCTNMCELINYLNTRRLIQNGKQAAFWKGSLGGRISVCE